MIFDFVSRFNVQKKRQTNILMQILNLNACKSYKNSLYIIAVGTIHCSYKLIKMFKIASLFLFILVRPFQLQILFLDPEMFLKLNVKFALTNKTNRCGFSFIDSVDSTCTNRFVDRNKKHIKLCYWWKLPGNMKSFTVDSSINLRGTFKYYVTHLYGFYCSKHRNPYILRHVLFEGSLISTGFICFGHESVLLDPLCLVVEFC